MKMLKVRRRFFYKIVAIVVVLTVGLFVVFSGPREYDRQVEIVNIERSIRSTVNRGECRLPDLPVHDAAIMKFYTPAEKIDCGDSLDDWVMCEKSICFVKPEVIAKYGDVTCSYTDIVRSSDYKSKFGKTTRTKDPYTLARSDFVKAVCRAEDGSSWYGIAHGIRYIEPPKTYAMSSGALAAVANGKSSFFNVVIIGFDSLSRNAFIRKLPKTYEYLTVRMQSIVLRGYNIVGDGTPQALVPLLTGFTELELPETRKRMRHSNTVDVYPMIWKEYDRRGYYTSFNEDLPSVGTFTYRMNGFDKQPVDHYLRTFYAEVPNIVTSSRKNCIGHQPDHMVMLEYTKNFITKYVDSPHFVFSFHGGLSHDSINLIGAADDDLKNWLSGLHKKALLDNTILVVMSDHGNRFAEIRSTLQGKQEERLPFFAFAFPESFKKRFPQEFANFVQNADKLTTPFDVHATLQHLLALQDSKPNKASEGEQLTGETLITSVPLKNWILAKKRAISLLDVVPKNRSCSDAYIEPHWCACLNWKLLPLNATNPPATPLLKVAANIVDTINNMTSKHRDVCAHLELEQINRALRLQPLKELLHFKHNADYDGFVADMTDDMRLHQELYQLQIVTRPGQGLYEASVTYDLNTFTAHTKESQISRINRYGSQARCIYTLDPELRKYCYCIT